MSRDFYRTVDVKRYKRVDGEIAVIWNMLMVSERRFRRLQPAESLTKFYRGTEYVDGVGIAATAATVAA